MTSTYGASGFNIGKANANNLPELSIEKVQRVSEVLKKLQLFSISNPAKVKTEKFLNPSYKSLGMGSRQATPDDKESEPRIAVPGELLARKGDLEIRTYQKGIDLAGLLIPYETFWNMRQYFRLGGELLVGNEALEYPCDWCGRVQQRPLEEVCRSSVKSLPFCSRACRNRVSSLRATVRRIYKGLGRREATTEELQGGFLKYQNTGLTKQKLADYLQRLGITEPNEKGGYNLAP